MKSKIIFVVLCATLSSLSVGYAQNDPNPAMNNPDKQAWDVFLQVNANAPSEGQNNALFETWARDGDTFQPTPVWPTRLSPIRMAPRALSVAALRAHAGLKVAVAPGGKQLVGEETRRNKADFDFIVKNNLFKVSGLQAAYQSGTPIVFPLDSVEVKANWVEVGRLKEFNGFTGTPAEAAKIYHVNSVGGKAYALVAFHIISKLVPNWTWATFEHKDNPGRCDVIGCSDKYGARDAFVAPLSPVESQTHYPDCVKSAALKTLLTGATIDPAFINYCLKGSQSDFTDPTGLAIRVGNSVTENGFVNQASCMSCHGRAAFDQTGHMTSFAGFDPISLYLPLTDNTGNAPVGAINPSWYWFHKNGPSVHPSLVDDQDLIRIAFPADFVWSIPFCAIDDTAKPPESKSRFCANK
jgi:hypothetical protein